MDRHRAQLLLLLVTKALTGIPIGKMMKEGWQFLLMLLPLLAMTSQVPSPRRRCDGGHLHSMRNEDPRDSWLNQSRPPDTAWESVLRHRSRPTDCCP
jgi:hypothetical protein